MRSFAAITVAVVGGLLASALAQEPTQNKSAGGDKDQSYHMMKMTGDTAKDMRMMNQMMMHKLGKKDANFEKRFIDMMIPHHEGAILMAKQALKEANRPELKEMAEKAIKDQEKEIDQLKRWRQQWYGGQ